MEHSDWKQQKLRKARIKLAEANTAAEIVVAILMEETKKRIKENPDHEIYSVVTLDSLTQTQNRLEVYYKNMSAMIDEVQAAADIVDITAME